MKKTTILIALCLMVFVGMAQKTIEKNLDHKGQFIEMDTPFASTIEVKTWDKPTVYFKATLSSETPELLELYKLEVKEERSLISIASDTEALFEAYKEKRMAQKKGYWCQEYEFNYVLYVPKNAQFKVKSINGSLQSDSIEGDFEADLINGDIEIKHYSGNLKLNTINGEIDVKVNNVDFTAETIHGDIYADEKLKLKAHDRHVGQKVESLTFAGVTKLKLNTINGNMYLRL